MILLEYKVCKDPAVRSINDEDKKKEDEWKRKDLNVRTIIISNISDKH